MSKRSRKLWIAVLAMTPALVADGPRAGAPVTTGLGADEAGVRYGQALGAMAVCRGVQVTIEARMLRARFQGPQLELFDRRAAEVSRLWARMASCVEAPEINMCRLVKERNCMDAEAQIGPRGSAIPRLIEMIREE